MTKKITDIKVMVASTVYGFEDNLSQIAAHINSLGYTVINSFKGAMKVDPHLSNLDNCLRAVHECDLFIGIIRHYYGSGNIKEKNITFEEIKLAIELKKPCWFLVHRDVVFMRRVERYVKFTKAESKSLKDKNIIDLRTLDIYDHVIKSEKPVELRTGNWAQEFFRLDDMILYIDTQLNDRSFVESLLEPKGAGI